MSKLIDEDHYYMKTKWKNQKQKTKHVREIKTSNCSLKLSKQNQNGGILKFYKYFKGVVGVSALKNIPTLLFIFKIEALMLSWEKRLQKKLSLVKNKMLDTWIFSVVLSTFVYQKKIGQRWIHLDIKKNMGHLHLHLFFHLQKM